MGLGNGIHRRKMKEPLEENGRDGLESWINLDSPMEGKVEVLSLPQL